MTEETILPLTQQADRYVLPPPPRIELYDNLFNQDPEVFWFLKNYYNDLQVSRESDGSVDYVDAGQGSTSTIDLNIAASTIGGNPEVRLNEDSYFSIDMSGYVPGISHRTLSAVIDGASSQAPILGLEKYKVSGAFYISHLISLGFPQSDLYKELRMRENLTAKDIVIELNGWVKEQLQKVEGVNYNDVLTIPGAAATFALVDLISKKVSLAHVADTIAVVNFAKGAKVLTNNLNAQFDEATEALVTQIMKDKGIERDIAAQDETVRKQLKDSFRAKINTEKGCGILNGMEELVTNNLIQDVTLDLAGPIDKAGAQPEEDPRELRIVLASDGFYTSFPRGANGGIDGNQIADFTDAEGQYFERRDISDVREVFLSDPHFKNVPRLKLVDDITFLSMQLIVNQNSRRRMYFDERRSMSPSIPRPYII